MHFGEWGFFGMHLLWWLFWIVVIVMAVMAVMAVVAVVAVMSGPERIVRQRETPLEILQRRYAAGEITEKEYEERTRTFKGDVRLME